MSEILRLFTRTHKLLRAASDEAMSRHGVRVGQNLLLEVLWETDNLTPGQLAERLGVATATVVKSAARMESAGLLTKHRDRDDARLVRLRLTAHGRAVREPVQRARRELEERVTSKLTEQERRHLRSALGKILAELTADGPNLAGGGHPHPPEDSSADR